MEFPIKKDSEVSIMESLLNRRKFLTLIGYGAAGILLSNKGCSLSETATNHPNIVLLFADDLGYGDLGCYGHPNIHTPNLDKIAHEGKRLTSFYVAASVCSPSRAALLTGRNPIRCGVPNVLGPDSKNGLPESEITIAELLKKQGYRTAAIGKWHLGSTSGSYMPTSRGFDYYYGLLYSNDMIPPWVKTDKPLQLYQNTKVIEHPVEQATLTERYTQEAIKFIEESKNQPFFLYVPYTMPHLPISASDKFLDKSFAGLYGDVIETIDWSAGQILDTLKKHGLDENTLFIFSSDNGPWHNLPPRMLQKGVERWHTGSPGLLHGAKGTTYEGGMRVPGIFRWPKQIPAGQVSSEMATSMDLFVTILKIAGAEIPSDRIIDGNDILSFLKGEAPSPTKLFYYSRGNRIEAIREDNWKLRLSRHMRDGLEPNQPLTPELFDLKNDPSEYYNIADRHPDIVSHLKEKLIAFAKEINAKVEEMD
jgi:arylsulfatase A